MIKLKIGCNPGAIGVERMDFVLLMDNPELTPSRGWTLFSPMERMFNISVQFEVKSLPWGPHFRCAPLGTGQTKGNHWATGACGGNISQEYLSSNQTFFIGKQMISCDNQSSSAAGLAYPVIRPRSLSHGRSRSEPYRRSAAAGVRHFYVNFFLGRPQPPKYTQSHKALRHQPGQYSR